jgi:hypothetical protein
VRLIRGLLKRAKYIVAHAIRLAIKWLREEAQDWREAAAKSKREYEENQLEAAKLEEEAVEAKEFWDCWSHEEC